MGKEMPELGIDSVWVIFQSLLKQSKNSFSNLPDSTRFNGLERYPSIAFN
jgi:hypothetical protein